MRNLRKLTAAVLAIALVLTSMTAVFAADTTATTVANGAQAQTLKDLGLYAGTDPDDATKGLEGALTTQDSLVFLAKLFGYSDAASKLTADEVTEALAKFDDAASISDYAKNVVAYSAINSILSGSTSKDGKTFFVGAKDTVTAARFATFMLKQMGYSVPAFSQSITQIAEVKGSKVSATVTGDLTRDVAVGMMYGALTAEKAAGKTVIEDIVGTDAAKLAIATKAGLIVPAVAAELDIKSVEVLNLREVIVTFNKAPIADEAKKKENYSIKASGSATTKDPEAATVSDDGLSVTLRTATGDNLSNYSTEVEVTVEKAVGLTADKTIKGITAKDTTVPSVEKVTTSGPRNMKVFLSEPIDEEAAKAGGNINLNAAFKIDGGQIGIETVSVSGREISIKTYSDLDEKQHKIEVVAEKLKDEAGYYLQVATITFDYVKDTSPLALEVVESNETSVTVKFNKALKSGSFGNNTTSITSGNNNVRLSHTYADLKAIAGDSGSVTTEDDQKFVINFGEGNPFPPSTTTVYLKYDSDSKTKIEDNYGNKLSATTFTVTTKADTTKPTATAEFVDANTVKVTYSEDVLNDGTANSSNFANNYVLKSGTDVRQITSFSYPTTGSKKIIELNTADDMLNGTTYTLTIKNVQDISVAKNKIDEVTLTFTGTDKVAPAVDSAVLASADKFRIVFTEAMDVASITDKTVYKIQASTDGGTTWGTPEGLKDKDTVEAANNNKEAIITLKDTTLADSTTYKVVIGRVKDAAGNWTKSFQMESGTFSKASVTEVALDEFQLVSRSNIKLIVKDTLQNVNYKDFTYSTGAGFVQALGIKEVSVVDGKTYITFVIAELAENTTGGGIEVRTVANADVNTKNAYGSKLKVDTTADTAAKTWNITDKCPAKLLNTSSTATTPNVPTFTTQTDNKGTAVPSLRSVTLKYSEGIYASSVQDTDYTVSGYDVDKVEVDKDAHTVTIFLKNVDYGSFTPGTDITVKQVGDIEDLARNITGPQDSITFN